ncbi:DNA (cytosine-5)-methyltransferase 1 [Natronobacillus azotifigens]|uniref:Cytosine-specific methyltransferase n=1 Tax=Natronobacillus azotifigens TaxID=472978 RepID=A0A9J6RFU7_9BACI|nr:DNA cytosine methyltransferase [Natronobacillus azotifigens]MCZ0704480.1 DNA cytosine methyltransferase [Natronobacillus azotifigens]
MIFKKGEIFCGPGGLSLGAKQAKVEGLDGEVYTIEHQWANDIDNWACETFRHNICPGDPESVIQQDVRELDIESLSPIDGFSFGFPCNDFSVVGKHKGFDGEYGPLYTFGVRVLNVHQPKWFVAENVGGLESANGGAAFFKILEDLEKEGYVLTPHLYKFHEYGVPQKRSRIIIVGIRKDLGLEFKVPKPIYDGTINPFVTVRQAFEDKPIKEDAFNNELTRHNAKVVEMLNYIPPGENAWYEGIPQELRLNVKGAKLSQIYKRLHPDFPSYTVTGSGGGGTHMYHYAEPRALTNRERARLQTFPDDYEFLGPKEQVRKQIGMAVPTLGAKVIFEAILKTFAGIEYEHIEPKWKAVLQDPKPKRNRKNAYSKTKVD